MSRKLNLSKLEGEIQKAVRLRTECAIQGDLDGYCSYTLQIRHYKHMYEKALRLDMDIDKIRKYNDVGCV